MMRRLHTIILLMLAWLASSGVVSADWQEDFSALLQRHVKSEGVDYRGWTASRADIDRLWDVAGAIAMEAPAGTKNQRLAWYLNAYNALVLHKMLATPSFASVSSAAAWREQFFKAKDLIVAGEKVSLDDLEQVVIGPTFKDPRVHFALHRASVSCPPSRNRAFTASSLNADLNALTRSFLSDHPNGVRVSVDGKSAEVSALFQWFRNDFDRGDVRAYINRYRAEPLPPETEITFLAYNWERNDSPITAAERSR